MFRVCQQDFFKEQFFLNWAVLIKMWQAKENKIEENPFQLLQWKIRFLVKSCMTFPSKGTSKISEQNPKHDISHGKLQSVNQNPSAPQQAAFPGTRHPTQHYCLGLPPHMNRRRSASGNTQWEQGGLLKNSKSTTRSNTEELEYSGFGFFPHKKKIPIWRRTFSNQLIFSLFVKGSYSPLQFVWCK